MKPIFVIALIATVLCGGCSTMKVVVQATDVISPVSLSPVVSTNGTTEASAGAVSGTAAARSTDFNAYVAERTTEVQYDSIEPTISVNVEGSHQNAINNVSIEVERRETGCFLLLGYYIEDETSCHLHGDKVRVKTSGSRTSPEE
jgi:hypothetical protein